MEYKVYRGKWEEPLIAAEKRVQESAAVKGKGKEDGKNKQKEKVQGWKGEEGVLKAKETVSKGACGQEGISCIHSLRRYIYI